MTNVRTIKFYDLNDYICENIFQYVSLAERVKFERVTKRWQQLLSRLWCSQLVLQIDHPINIEIKDGDCYLNEHVIRENDVIITEDLSEEKRTQAVHSLISRVSKLKALHYHSKQKLELSKLPLTLEHLTIDKQSSLVFDKLDLKNLTCFSSSDVITSVEQNEQILTFMENNLQLQRITLIDLTDQVWTSLTKMRDLKKLKAGFYIKDLEHLEIFNTTPAAMIVDSFPNLEHISAYYMTWEHYDHYEKLVSVTFYQDEEMSDEHSLRIVAAIFDKYRHCLKRFRYKQNYEDDDLCHAINFSPICDVIEELNIYALDMKTLTESKKPFQKLRKLTGECVDGFWHESFAELLNKCPKLCYIGFNEIRIDEDDILKTLNPLFNYANAHPKRKIVFKARFPINVYSETSKCPANLKLVHSRNLQSQAVM